MRLAHSVRECLLEAARMRQIRKAMYNILDREAALPGTNLKEIITVIWEASDQQIKRDAAIGIANKAVVTGLATTPEEVERVVGIATKWAYCAGLDVEYCVDVFVTAAARQSRKLAADKLGLVVGDGALAGLIGAERTQEFLEAMIRATGWDWVRIGIAVGIEA